jgi:bacillithiol biosynthesis cysteine-adding enzyme BshC
LKEQTNESAAGRARTIEKLPFREIPGQTPLFIRYQDDPTSLTNFYPTAVSSAFDVADHIPAVLSSYTTDRSVLADALAAYNSYIGAPAEVLANIERLRNADCVAVLTGQQCGLFTGPLYTIYKAISAVSMAMSLTRRGHPAVAVFWAATEDHDIDEVSTASVIGSAGLLQTVTVSSGETFAGMPVGRVSLGEQVAAAVENLVGAVSGLDELAGFLDATWHADTAFGEAFARTLARLLGRFGLVVADPLQPELKTLAAPIYARALETCGELVGNLRTRSSELVDTGYHAQVLVDESHVPLFWHSDDGRRLALKRTGPGIVSSKGRSEEFKLAELAELALREPERFSPAVTLRPVVQDVIFPTVCYFGGAAEVAYFAQVNESYRTLGRPVTPILHRQSFTLIEPRNARTLDRYSLALSEMFDGAAKVTNRIAERELDPALLTAFSRADENLNAELHILDTELGAFDPTLSANLATRRRKIAYHIAALRKKTLAARVRRDDEIERRLGTAFESLLPNGGLQERTINVFSFLGRYGERLIDTLFESADLEDRDHRIIYL